MKSKQFALSLGVVALLAAAGCSTGQNSESTAQEESMNETTAASSVEAPSDTAWEEPFNANQEAGMVTSSDENSVEAAGQAPSNQAQSDTSGEKATFSAANFSNSMALNQLHHINQKEIELAKLAQEKAQSADVKSAAQQIQNDHQQLDTQVQSVAKAQNIELQEFQPSTYEKAAMTKMKALEGAQFDQAFSANMKMSHKQAAQQLRTTRADIKDTQVKGLIDAALPKVQQHHKMSKKMENKASEQAGSIATE